MEQTSPLHSFHIPVLGTGFTIDTPVKVAPYGISSVISLVDDHLIESMRAHYCEKTGKDYTPITPKDEDYRARRIESYLNLLEEIIQEDFDTRIAEPFVEGSFLWDFMEMLPEGDLKQAFLEASQLEGQQQKEALQKLRPRMKTGSIDVNIMTKLDGPKGFAHSALRGFAQSDLDAAVVLSAGMNPSLFDLLGKYEDFKADAQGHLKKRIIIKVSDYRSAQVQGRMLARKGLWVSEYRIESGLNCGGHTFPSQGVLLGPILEEFRTNKEKLQSTLIKAYEKGGGAPLEDSRVRVTVQGGIGTHEEDRFLQEEFEMDGTGWGSPFMLVPEAVNMDDEHLELLKEAGEEEIFLSDASPFGVPFWNVIGAASEKLRLSRIAQGFPGAPCVKGFIALNEEYGKPLCTASKAFLSRKLEELKLEELPQAVYDRLRNSFLAKACICHDLAGCATKTLGIDKKATPAMTPGPNLAYFKKIATLKEMVSHIYGRLNLISAKERPHMFLKELELYIKYLRQQGEDFSLGLLKDGEKTLQVFLKNLNEGIGYYHRLAEKLAQGTKESFLKRLEDLNREFHTLQDQLEKNFQSPVAG